MTEQTANSTETTSSTATDLPAPRLNQPVAVSPQPDSGVQSNPAATHTPAAAMASQNSTATSHSETLYVIKPGDTLTRIAKTHGTTVKALKAANGLGNDRIVVGAKLKIPEA